MKSLVAALRFLTIAPIPGDWGSAQEDLARSLPWFPIVGLGLGVGLAAGLAWGWRGAHRPWSPLPCWSWSWPVSPAACTWTDWPTRPRGC